MSRGSPTYDFDGTVVLVTGAARGQGRSHAVAFAEAGADVAAMDVCEPSSAIPYDLASENDLRAAVAAIDDVGGGEAIGVTGDVTDESDVTRAVRRAVDELGRLDVLVNNAGVWHVEDVVDLDRSAWDAVVATNLTGAWLCAKHAAREMRDQGDSGRIVSIGSSASIVGTPGSGHYAAAKHALVGLTKTLAVELGPAGITVNLVCPTGVDTEIVDGTRASHGEEPFERIADASGKMSLLPEKGLLAPDDVTDAVLWLASDGADNVTGQTLPVDRGMSIK